MKRFKSLLSLLLVLVMMMSLAVPALAVDGDPAEEPGTGELAATYTITFDGNGGTNQWGVTTNKQEPVSGETKLWNNTYSREGYKFLGWSTDKNNTEPTYKNYDTVDVTEDIRLYAVWEKIPEAPTGAEVEAAGSIVTLKCEEQNLSKAQKVNKFSVVGEVKEDATGWYCEVTVDVNDYLAKFNSDAGETHRVVGSETETVTYRWADGKWTTEDKVTFEVTCEEPAPDAPVKALVSGKLSAAVACSKDNTHNTTVLLADDQFGYTAPADITKQQDGTYTGTAKITVILNKLNVADHAFSGSNPVFDLPLVYSNGAWSLAPSADTTLDVTAADCTKVPEPTAPELPGVAELAALIDVKVDCEKRGSRHQDEIFALIAQTYELTPVAGDAASGYTTTVTVKAAEYVKAYNEKVAKGHVLVENDDGKETVTLKYDADKGAWTVVGAAKKTVTFQVEHGYTVTYEWKGDAPYGVEPPVDSKIYGDGDTAYVAAAPRDEAWSCKGGEWKWDRINERWYWDGCSHGNHNHTYWYADKVDGQIGYWVFTGWERQVWVDGNRWQHGYWKTETLRPGQKITVNSDVVIYGTWEFKAAAGTVVLSKTVKGLDTDDSFTFEIYDANNTRKPYKVVELEDGGRTYVSLPNGTYYITEVDAEVKGYDLVVTVDGDIDADGGKFTIKGDAKVIKYTNTYKLGGPALNKEDHIAYITGYADGTVKPDANITREEVATIFYRLLTAESRERYATNSNSFTDVKATRWSNTAISTLANAGIIDGYPDGSFKPTAYITRGEMANIISKFAELTGGRTTFTDISNHWAAAAIRSAAANGWINGYKDGTFKPNQYITRAETVSMINRVLERNPDTVGDLLNGMKTFTDNMKTTKWYYFAIQEAANGHSYSRDPYGNESWTKLN